MSPSAEFYRPFGAIASSKDASVSSLGIGTYLGECNDSEDDQYYRAVLAALDRGITLIDTAINYRCQRSERVIGRVLADVAPDVRNRTVVCTKGGYVPLEPTPPQNKTEYRAYLKREYFDTGVVQPNELVVGGHCITPSFLMDQVSRSRSNLGVEAIDLYYLHNPEQQLNAVSRDAFYERLRDAFVALEQCVAEGKIRAYGCATWQGLRVARSAPEHLSLETLVSLAREAGGAKHHFAAIQLPINLAMTEAIRVVNQTVNGSPCNTLEAAAALGLSVIASAPLMQAQLAKNLPEQVRASFPNASTDAQCALAFVTQLPGVTSVLVGMRSLEHLEENLHIA